MLITRRCITLTQSVITQLQVYWAHLIYLRHSIIKYPNQIMDQYIWSGATHINKYHLVKLDYISMPKRLGGWGILNLRCFGWALLQKTLWRGLFGAGIYDNIIRYKYLKDKGFTMCMCRGSIGTTSISSIWLSLNKFNFLFAKLVFNTWVRAPGHDRTGTYSQNGKGNKHI